MLAGFMSLSSVVACAAERYVEVWNPPESQTHKAKPKTRNMVPVQAKKKRKSAPAVKQVADRTTVAPPALSTGSASGARARVTPKPTDSTPRLPPLIGPDGRVLRV